MLVSGRVTVSHLKVDGWKTIFFPLGVSAHFQGRLLLVSGNVTCFCLFNSVD